MTSTDNITSAVIDGCRVERLPQKNFSVPVIFKFKVERVFESFHPDPETAFHYYKNGFPSKGAWPTEYERVIDGFTISRVSTIGTPFKYKIKEKNEYFNSNSHDIGVAFYRYCLERNPFAPSTQETTSVFGSPWTGRPLGCTGNYGGFGTVPNSGGFGGTISSSGILRSSHRGGCFGNFNFGSCTPSEKTGNSTDHENDGNFDLKPSKINSNIERQEPSAAENETT